MQNRPIFMRFGSQLRDVDRFGEVNESLGNGARDHTRQCSVVLPIGSSVCFSVFFCVSLCFSGFWCVLLLCFVVPLCLVVFCAFVLLCFVSFSCVCVCFCVIFGFFCFVIVFRGFFSGLLLFDVNWSVVVAGFVRTRVVQRACSRAVVAGRGPDSRWRVRYAKRQHSNQQQQQQQQPSTGADSGTVTEGNSNSTSTSNNRNSNKTPNSNRSHGPCATPLRYAKAQTTAQTFCALTQRVVMDTRTQYSVN